jgi:hypothetical protein
MGYKEELNDILAKEPKDITEPELRILIAKVGYLSDSEREKFKSLLVRENLTKQEVDKYRSVLLLDLYFPKGVK